MILHTALFGPVHYDPQDNIRLRDMMDSMAGESRWLLLADRHHPRLFWLQNLDDTSLALPVCSLAGAHIDSGVRLSRLQALPDWSAPSTLIGLAEICCDSVESRLDTSRPILIDARTRRGVRCEVHSEQMLQQAPSAKAVRMRECA